MCVVPEGHAPRTSPAAAVVLHPLSRRAAAALADGDFTAVNAADGWPHDDTLDGPRLAADGPGRAWLVILDGLVVGECGTHGPVGPGGTVEIGYGLAAPYRGRGHGRQVVSALARSLLHEPDIAELIAHTDTANIPSRRALEGVGFRLTGEQDGQCRYVLRG